MSHNSPSLTTRSKNKISSEADKLILIYLFSEERYRDFFRYANQFPDIFGSTSSDKARVAARNRKNYIRNQFIANPKAIIGNLHKEGLSSIAVKVESDIEGFVRFHSQKATSTPTKLTPSKKAKVTLVEPEDDSIHSANSAFSSVNSGEEEQGDCTHRTKSSMSSISSHRLPVQHEYLINLDEPEMTQGNMFPLLCKEVKKDGVLCDKLCLKLKNIDLSDYTAKLYSARLADDFASVLLTLPRIPAYERNRKEVDHFHEQCKKVAKAKAGKGQQSGWSCDTAYTSHLRIVAMYEEQDQELLMTIQYHFPDNITCNNKYFNDGAGSEYKLIPKLVGFKRDPQFFASLIFEMVVDGSIRNYGARRLAAPSEEDEVLELIAGMSV
jgi:hypothetical protein